MSRTRDGPARFLKGYKQTIVADAYGGYDGTLGEFLRMECWLISIVQCKNDCTLGHNKPA
jgi:hypothetical protein